jgi:hypothetical protein
MRAAVVGGVAYHAGKRRQEGMEREEEQEYRLQELEAQQSQQAYAAPPQQYAAPPPAPAAPAGITNEAIQQLQQLAALKEQGVLSEEEFEVQKRRLLGTA